MPPLPPSEHLRKLTRADLETAFIANWWVADMLALRLADLAAAFARIDRAAAGGAVAELRAFAARDLAAQREKAPQLVGPISAVAGRVDAALRAAEDAVEQAGKPGH